MVRCPVCRAEVQPDWDWCHACGWDPEGLAPAGDGTTGGPAPAGAPPRVSPLLPPVARGGGPGSIHAGYGAAPRRPAPSGSSSTARTVVLVLLACGAALGAVIVVLVLAVTLLGTSSTSSVAEPARTTADDGVGPPPLGELTTTVPPGGPPVPAEWTRFTAPDGSWSMDFPLEPEVTSVPSPGDDGTIERVDTFGADLGNVQYGVMIFQVQPGVTFADPAFSLDAFAEKFVGEADGTITSRQLGTYAYSSSLTFHGVANDTPGDTLDGILFINGRRLYLLLVFSSGGEAAQVERFFSSLTLG